MDKLKEIKPIHSSLQEISTQINQSIQAYKLFTWKKENNKNKKNQVFVYYVLNIACNKQKQLKKQISLSIFRDQEIDILKDYVWLSIIKTKVSTGKTSWKEYTWDQFITIQLPGI